VLRGINSECIDLIATAPPFNKKRPFNAPLGSRAAGQKFEDRWVWDEVTDEWHDLIATDHPAIKEIIEASAVIEGGTVDRGTGKIDTGRVKNSIAAFLVWMTPRLIEMRRVLKPTGSIYLHCDPEASHYLKLLMDAVFGRGNFRSEIVWSYSGGGMPKKDFGQKHDIILRYSKSDTWTFNKQYRPYADSCSGRHSDGTPLNFKRGARMTAVWNDLSPVNTQAKERTGWKTQKSLALYQRIIKASSNKSDSVLDPFCGCATTYVAAELLDRKWIGIDVDPVVATVTKDRLSKESGIFQQIDDDFVETRREPPKRTDIDKMSNVKMRLVLCKK